MKENLWGKKFPSFSIFHLTVRLRGGRGALLCKFNLGQFKDVGGKAHRRIFSGIIEGFLV